MTVEEILAEVDMKYPNDVDKAHKWGWITQLEKLIVDECFLTHIISDQEKERVKRAVETVTFSRDYLPLAQPPYQDVYIHYLSSKIAQLNVDTDAYENESTLFNNALLTYKNMFNRTHRSIDKGQRWRF